MNGDALVRYLVREIAAVEHPSRSQACKLIRALHPTLNATLREGEICITYRGTRGPRRQALAYFTTDAADAVATARRMTNPRG